MSNKKKRLHAMSALAAGWMPVILSAVPQPTVGQKLEVLHTVEVVGTRIGRIDDIAARSRFACSAGAG